MLRLLILQLTPARRLSAYACVADADPTLPLRDPSMASTHTSSEQRSVSSRNPPEFEDSEAGSACMTLQRSVDQPTALQTLQMSVHAPRAPLTSLFVYGST